MSTDRSELRRILDEFAVLHVTAGDPTAEAVHFAVMLEDVFGVSFSDAEMVELVDRRGIERVMRQKLGDC